MVCTRWAGHDRRSQVDTVWNIAGQASKASTEKPRYLNAALLYVTYQHRLALNRVLSNHDADQETVVDSIALNVVSSRAPCRSIASKC